MTREMAKAHGEWYRAQAILDRCKAHPNYDQDAVNAAQAAVNAAMRRIEELKSEVAK